MNHIPISISTVICRSQSLEEALHSIAAAGFSYVEICPWHAFELLEQDLRALLQKLKLKIGTIHLPFKDYDITHLDDRERDGILTRLEKLIELAPSYNIPVLVLHPNSSEVKSREELALRQELFLASVSRLEKKAAEANVVLALENMMGPRGIRFGSHADEIIDWVHHKADQRWGVCIDTTHSVFNEEDPIVSIAAAGSKLAAIHASDTQPKKHNHALLGNGVVDWQGFVRCLREINYQGLFTLEIYETENWHSDLREAKAFTGKLLEG